LIETGFFELTENPIPSISIFDMIPGIIDHIKVKKTLEERLNGEIWMRSPPLPDHPARIKGK
jgi:hypothetical protein